MLKTRFGFWTRGKSTSKIRAAHSNGWYVTAISDSEKHLFILYFVRGNFWIILMLCIQPLFCFRSYRCCRKWWGSYQMCNGASSNKLSLGYWWGIEETTWKTNLHSITKRYNYSVYGFTPRTLYFWSIKVIRFRVIFQLKVGRNCLILTWKKSL